MVSLQIFKLQCYSSNITINDNYEESNKDNICCFRARGEMRKHKRDFSSGLIRSLMITKTIRRAALVQPD